MCEYLRAAVLVATVGAGAMLAGAAEAAPGPCSPEPTDMSLAYGDLISCDITPATDVDLYRFAGHAGDTILAEAAKVSGSVFAPRIQLLAPDGSLIGDSTNPPRVAAHLPQSGTYTVFVFNNFVGGGATAGEYTVVVSCTGGSCDPTPPANPPTGNIACEPEPTDQFPGYGTRVSCDITPATDVDIYRFAGAAGDRVLAEAAFVSGDVFAPRVQVLAPDGTLLGDSTNPPRVGLVLPQSGTYTVFVFNNFVGGGATSGQYTFVVSCAGGSCLPAPGKVPAITLTLTGCSTCHPGDMFTVKAHLTNPASKTIQTEIKFGLRLPDGTAVNTLGNKHLEIPFPAGLNTNLTLATFPWPTGLPQGTWSVEGTLLGPDLGDTFSRATLTFASAP
jgi:hypothetical protein